QDTGAVLPRLTRTLNDANDEVPIQLNAEVTVNGAPVKIERPHKQIPGDTARLVASIKPLTRLLLTESAFRILVSDILTTTREIVAETASEIGQAAANVEAAAFSIAQVATTGEAVFEVKEAAERAQDDIAAVGLQSAERVKENIIERIQLSVSQIQSRPEYKDAMSTVLRLLQKYSDKLGSLTKAASDEHVAVSAEIDMSESFAEALGDLKILLERFASHHSLDPLLHSFKAAITDVLAAPNSDLREYLSVVGVWFERALSDPSFARSAKAKRGAEELYDTGKLLLAAQENARWARDFRQMVSEAQAFSDALQTDKSTRQLLQAIQHTVAATEDMFLSAPPLAHPASAQEHPELADARVEYKSKTLDVAVDAVLLTPSSTSASLSPDSVLVQNWNEFKLDMTVPDAVLQASSRTRARVEGVRCSAHGFGGEGIVLDVDIETIDEERRTPGEPLFKVRDVTVDVPGLAFNIRHSRHSILNTLLLQPLSAPVVRLVLRSVLEQQVHSAVEWADRLVTAMTEEAVRIGARRNEDPTIQDYYAAALTTAPAFFESSPSTQPTGTSTSHTDATFKGIIHTTMTVPENDDDPVEETVLAVGGGAQLFPNKGVPESAGPSVLDTVVDGARELVGKRRTPLQQRRSRPCHVQPNQTERFRRKRDCGDVPMSEQASAGPRDAQDRLAVRVWAGDVGVRRDPVVRV
ncbi:unnamed protein product, partial [Mycena citricolor]